MAVATFASSLHATINESATVVVNLFLLPHTFKFAGKSVHSCHALKSKVVKE